MQTTQNKWGTVDPIIKIKQIEMGLVYAISFVV